MQRRGPIELDKFCEKCALGHFTLEQDSVARMGQKIQMPVVLFAGFLQCNGGAGLYALQVLGERPVYVRQLPFPLSVADDAQWRQGNKFADLVVRYQTLV